MDIVKKTTHIMPDVDDDIIELGQWYWYEEGKEPWLGCVTEIGSNYITLSSPRHKSKGYYNTRIHFKELFMTIRKEDNPIEYLQGKILQSKEAISQTLLEIKKLTQAIGMQNHVRVCHNVPELTDSSRELALVSSTVDINQYKLQLIKAKEEDLPQLFKKVKEQNEDLCMWMTAEALPMEALAGDMKSCLSVIEGRIFNVSLYAGLTESIIQIQDGTPANIDEKLHIMQTVLFMDEECLLNYQTGGMEFNDLDAFDKWLCKPENLNRILPFNRTLVAMRVRRHQKTRETFTISDAFVNFQLGQLDKKTFMFMRNGEQVFRMTCDLDFGEQLFPGKEVYNQTEPLRFSRFSTRIDKIITESEYQGRLAEHEERTRKHEEWVAQHPGEHYFHSPFSHSNFNPSEWTLFNQDTVYFDDCQKVITDQIQQYNRIVLIIQGLFDRSLVFHPHLPVKTWTAEGFEKAIKPIYDKDNVIEYGQAPDFLEFKKYCNSFMNGDSIVTGQEEIWEQKEAERENELNASKYSYGKYTIYEKFRPYGNPGPGRVSRMSKWKRNTRKGVFTWNRFRTRGYLYDNDTPDVPCKLIVDQNDLFNISAYKPGDFKRFFDDPRTRKDYLRWANLLLTAEEYHAGNIKITLPTR